MDLPAFSPTLNKLIIAIRYAVYAGSVVLATVDGAQLQELGVLAVLAAAMHMSSHRLRGVRSIAALHVLEQGVVAAVVGYADASVTVQLLVLFLFLPANAALFGPRYLPLYAVASATGIAAGNHPFETLRVGSEDWVMTLAFAVAMVFAVAIGLIAHAQAQWLVRAGARIKTTNLGLLAFLPRGVQEHLQRRDRAQWRKRRLTVAFVDLVGFTDTSRTAPVESLAEALNDYLSEASELALRWGGEVSKFLGDGVLLVFESDGRDERRDNARQCLHCVRAVAERVVELNRDWRDLGLQFEFTVTAGVASGYCAVGEWGSDARKDFTAIGVPVNLAARLQAAATWAFMDEATARLAGSAGHRTELDVKGFGSIGAYVVPH